jgi:uncharacterized protein with von Willebrand factor type A (vWA) domain
MILISKGTDVISDPKFTHSWEAYKRNNEIRIITAVTGGEGAGALTELSDHVAILNDGTIRGKGKEFSGLIDMLTVQE